MKKLLSVLWLSVLFLALTPHPAQAIDFNALGCAVNFLLGDTDCTKEWTSRFASDMFTSIMLASTTTLGGTGTETLRIPGETSSLELADEKNINPYLSGGALGAVALASRAVYRNPPDLKTGDFFRQTLANNIFNVPPAYGQRTGVEILNESGVLNLWRAFRNVSYIFMVIVLLAFGLMVILRYRIDPRTVVTVQAAIPKVTIALILITFSYPIAGFLMDLGNVLTELVRTTLTGIGVSSLMPTGFGPIWGAFVFHWIPFDPGPSALGYFAIELFFQLVMRILAFFIAFKIFWTLISRYAMLFVQVIIAPFSFLWGALPGQQDHTTRWFKGVVVNVLVFPAIYLIVNIANIVRLLGLGPGSTGIPLPPAFAHTGDISGLVALGILATAPKVPAVLEDALDITPSGHVAKAGVEPRSVLKSIPLLGKLF